MGSFQLTPVSIVGREKKPQSRNENGFEATKEKKMHPPLKFTEKTILSTLLTQTYFKNSQFKLDNKCVLF